MQDLDLSTIQCGKAKSSPTTNFSRKFIKYMHFLLALYLAERVWASSYCLASRNNDLAFYQKSFWWKLSKKSQLMILVKKSSKKISLYFRKCDHFQGVTISLFHTVDNTIIDSDSWKVAIFLLSSGWFTQPCMRLSQYQYFYNVFSRELFLSFMGPKAARLHSLFWPPFTLGLQILKKVQWRYLNGQHTSKFSLFLQLLQTTGPTNMY